MHDAVALGELLIDFTPAGKSENGSPLFETNPGGAPANVLAVLSKFDHKTAFIGKVGNDPLGAFLRSVLEKSEIDPIGLTHSEEVNTTLAFVHLDDQGDRSFHFYRAPGADMMLNEQEVDSALIQNAKIFHFGSLSMTHESVKTATLKAVKAAKENGVLISYDPNLRPALWKSVNHAKETILEGMHYADVLKISEEELAFMTETTDFEKGSKFLYEAFNLKLILITLGEEGCFYRLREKTGHISGFKVKAVDTTGAGDIFLGSFLHQVLEKSTAWDVWQTEDLEKMIIFANAAAALGTTKKGAIPAIPTLDDVSKFIIFGEKTPSSKRSS